VVIIGDAAHASKPNGGQGGSVSLEDAATLAIAINKTNAALDYDEARDILGEGTSFGWSELNRLRVLPCRWACTWDPDDPFAKEGWTKENDPLFWFVWV